MAKRTRRRRGSGNLSQLKVELWASILEAMAIVEDAESDAALKLRAIHAVAITAGVYRQLWVSDDHEQRLSELETTLARGPYGRLA